MPNLKKPRPKCRCASCPNAVKRPTDTFCSLHCQQEHRYEQYIDAWLSGRVSGGKSWCQMSAYVRRYLKRTRGERCEICGWAEVNPHTGTIPLHLDHIDGNWANNRPENLRLLCPNHHALTSNYGSRNRGNGRPFVVYKRQPIAGR